MDDAVKRYVTQRLSMLQAEHARACSLRGTMDETERHRLLWRTTARIRELERLQDHFRDLHSSVKGRAF